ncbi:hypothetical protein AB0Q95_06090 [Streptomyces sp. NPDC059900]|uniref:hypothetical protein n=1 Tax=Streptomyces sp. NPDC059900 TaxID=3155816 RepID=UPI0034131ADD
MGRTVRMARLPRITPQDQASPEGAGQDGHMTALALEAGRAGDSVDVLGEVALAVLTASGASRPLAHRMSDAASVAAHYVITHSSAARIRLLISVHEARITLAVTDYDGKSPRPPAWLPVSRHDTLELAGLCPGVDPLQASPDAADGLQLHRTPDGYMRLALCAAWQSAPAPP